MARRLHIKIIEAKNLVNLDPDEQVNPYCVLRLKNQHKEDFETTDIKSNTTNPVWNQEFTILAVDPNDVLLIGIYNKRTKKDVKLIEEVEFPVKLYEILAPAVRKEVDLTLKKKKKFLQAGKLVLEINAIAATDSKPRDPHAIVEHLIKVQGIKIHIKCIDAKDIMKVNLGAKPDPYLRFKINDTVVKSKPAMKTLCPVWNEELEIISTDPTSDNLEVDLVDNDLNRNEIMMNPIIIPVSEHTNGSHYVYDDYIKLKKKNAGKLHFELDFSKVEEMYVHPASAHKPIKVEKPVEQVPVEERDFPAPANEPVAEEPVPQIDFPQHIELPTPQIEAPAPAEEPVPQTEISTHVEEPAPQIEVTAPASELSAPEIEVPAPVEEPAPQTEISTAAEEPAPEIEVPAPTEEPAPQTEISTHVERLAPQIEIPAPAGEPAPNLDFPEHIELRSSQIEITEPAEEPVPQTEVQSPLEEPTPQVETPSPEIVLQDQAENVQHEKENKENKIAHLNGRSQFKVESVKGQIVGAHNLPKTNSNGADIYAVATIISKGEKDKKGEKIKTSVCHFSQDPVWNKEFDFQYLKDGDDLRIEIYQLHKILGDQLIACTEIPLKCIEENKPIEQTYKLEKPRKVPKAYKKVTDFGNISLSLIHNIQYN